MTFYIRTLLLAVSLEVNILRHIKPYFLSPTILHFRHSKTTTNRELQVLIETVKNNRNTIDNMSNHINVPKEDDDKINRTLRENLPDNINEVDLGSKEQKGMYSLSPSPNPSSPHPLCHFAVLPILC